MLEDAGRPTQTYMNSRRRQGAHSSRLEPLAFVKIRAFDHRSRIHKALSDDAGYASIRVKPIAVFMLFVSASAATDGP